MRKKARNETPDRPRYRVMTERTPRKRTRTRARKSAQEGLPFPEHKPKKKRRRRVKLGRPPRPERAGFVPHKTRPEHNSRHPVHVTIRCADDLPSLRSEGLNEVIVRSIRQSVKRGIGVLHYTIQDDHLHLMVEAADEVKLARGMQGLFSQMAVALNEQLERKGSVFRDRHHRHVLKTPSEVRRALVYILFNSRKHDTSLLYNEDAIDWIDEASSAMWFEGWDPEARPPQDEVTRKRAEIGESPLAAATTWLARVGWQRAGGPLRFNERPRIVR